MGDECEKGRGELTGDRPWSLSWPHSGLSRTALPRLIMWLVLVVLAGIGSPCLLSLLV
jgi:hypothetical protein